MFARLEVGLLRYLIGTVYLADVAIPRLIFDLIIDLARFRLAPVRSRLCGMFLHSKGYNLDRRCWWRIDSCVLDDWLGGHSSTRTVISSQGSNGSRSRRQ